MACLGKNIYKAVLCNQLLEAVVKKLPIFNAGGEVNKSGGMKVIFPNPEDIWITGWRWRDMRLKKDPLDGITEAGFLVPTT